MEQPKVAMLTDDEIRALLDLEIEATPAPWLQSHVDPCDMLLCQDAALATSARNALRPLCDEVLRLRAEEKRLRDVLHRIDGGDSPCTDEAKLRQWAYECLTLGRSVEDLS